MDISSRRFYRGRSRTFQAPLDVQPPQPQTTRTAKKNLQCSRRRGTKRAREEAKAEPEDMVQEAAVAVRGTAAHSWLLCTGQPASGKKRKQIAVMGTI